MFRLGMSYGIAQKPNLLEKKFAIVIEIAG